MPGRVRTLITALLVFAWCVSAADFPFFALCMDTHDARKRNLEEQARMLKDLGYAGAGHLWLTDLDQRLATLDAAGLRLFQVYLSLNIDPKGKNPYDPGLNKALQLLKGRDVMLALLVTGGKPSDETRDPQAVALLREIADMARPNGVRVVLYPHVNNWLERVEDGIRLTRKVERSNVGVMFNLCHWLKLDEESRLQPLLKSALPYLMAVSINGTDDGVSIKTGKGNWIQPLDSGTFRVSTVLRTLEELGYRGPVGLQCYGIAGDARDHLSRSMAAWRKLGTR